MCVRVSMCMSVLVWYVREYVRTVIGIGNGVTCCTVPMTKMLRDHVVFYHIDCSIKRCVR